LLVKKNYYGFTMKARLWEYKGKKELLSVFPNKLHFSKRPSMVMLGGGITRIEAGMRTGTLDILESELSANYPALIITFNNISDTTKELVIENLSDLMIIASLEKSIFPIGISAMDYSEPSTSFPPAKLTNWKLRFVIPTKDSIEIGYLFPEAKKDDVIIFDSAFVKTIK